MTSLFSRIFKKLTAVLCVLVLMTTQQAGAFTPNDFACANQGDFGGTCFYDPNACSGDTSASTVPGSPTNPGSLIWPFATKNSSQYDRVDQGWDIQDKPGANIYAIAPGTLHVYLPDPGMFGNDYPVEELDSDIGGPSKFIYYGHVHIIPSLRGTHVEAGQLIAHANTTDGENGSGAPPGWLEIGFARPGTDAPVATSIPSPEGQKIKDLLINTQPGSGSVSPDPSAASPGQAGCCSAAATPTGSSVPDSQLPGRDNREKIWNYLISQKWTPVQAAGIEGNIGREGVYDPTNIEDPAGRTTDWNVFLGLTGQTQGYGLIGFTPGVSLAKSGTAGADWSGISKVDVNKDNFYFISTQLNVVYGYMKNSKAPDGKNMLEEYQNKSTSTAAAANAFQDLVENAGVVADGIRDQYAADAMRDFGSGAAVSIPAAPAPGGGCCPSAGGGGGGGGSVALTGSNNAEKAFNYFVSQELPPEAAAGLVGNFQQESGTTLDTHSDNGSHTGIAQWDTGGRWAGLLSHERGKDPYDIATQLDYVWYELNGTYKSAVLNPLKSVKTTDEAAKIVFDSYEIAGDDTLPDRQTFAKILLGKYGNGGGAAGADCAASNAGANGWDLNGPNAMVYFGQCDPKWANHPYGAGKSSICEGGCGITSMAMVVATLSPKGKNETPKTLADQYGGAYHDSGGTSWALWPVAARDYGLHERDIGLDLNAAADTVKAGGLVIISIDPGAFTSGGHIMVIRAVNDKGEFLLADPNNDANKNQNDRGDTNNTGYSADFLKNQGALKHLWAFTK
jgi:hypothetical protein